MIFVVLRPGQSVEWPFLRVNRQITNFIYFKYNLPVNHYQTFFLYSTKIKNFWTTWWHFIFNPRRCHKRTLGIEHFCKGHDGDDDGTYDIKFDDAERKRGVKTSEIKGGKDDEDESDY